MKSEIVLAALLATIRAEWGSVDTWEIHAGSFNGMPEGADYDRLVEELRALEIATPH